jgi:hypothetical protein
MRLNAYAAVSAWSAHANASAIVQKRQQSVGELFSSLKSGDLANAQKAFARVASSSPVLTPTSPMAQIGAALDKGQLGDANQIAQTIASYKNSYAAYGSQERSNSTPSPITPSQPTPTLTLNNMSPARVSSNNLAQLFGQGSQVDLYV